MSYAEIPGWSGFLPLYDEAVARFPDGSTFVEVGVALGHSLAYLARKVIDAHVDIEVWGVDPWGGRARNGEQQEFLGQRTGGDFGLFVSMMTKHAPEELEFVNIVRTESARAARLFRDSSVDLVLIDGAHDVDSVLQDLEAWQPKVRRGGILAGDDYSPSYPGVVEAVHVHFGAAVEVNGTTWRVRR
jgi:hypothetical protein